MNILRALAVSLVFVTTGCVGITRREESIEASLLRRIPIGTNREAVVAFAQKEGWTDVRVNTQRGYWKHDPGTKAETIGASSVSAFLGQYYSPFLTMVTVDWAFDSEGRLIGVWVRKSVDAL